MSCRLIYDLCTPTRDRRPTTSEDIDNDIHVTDYATEEELFDDLLYIIHYDADEIGEYTEGSSLKEVIEQILSWFNDPGDGSPNFLYCNINGDELKSALAYDCLDGKDLKTISEDEVKKLVKAEFVTDDLSADVESDITDKIAEILDDYGILYGDIVDNGHTVNLVGIDESEWAEAREAIETELQYHVNIPDEDHSEDDDELVVVINESLSENLVESSKDFFEFNSLPIDEDESF